jgi:transcription antitermination factor NusG
MTQLGQTENPWFALHIKSNFEKVTATILGAKGLDVYFPSFRSRRRWSDRVKEIDLPLFPGYLFCRFNPHNRLPILTTPGVLSVVGVAKTPAPIAEDEIRSVQRIVESGLAARPWPFLHVGQRVIIEKGALQGIEGILLEVKHHYRIVVSISLLQRSIAAEIDSTMVRAVSAAPARRQFLPIPEVV